MPARQPRNNKPAPPPNIPPMMPRRMPIPIPVFVLVSIPVFVHNPPMRLYPRRNAKISLSMNPSPRIGKFAPGEQPLPTAQLSRPQALAS